MCHDLAYPLETAKCLGIEVTIIADTSAPPVEVAMSDTPRVRLNRWCGLTGAQLGALLESLCMLIAKVAQHVLGIVERPVIVLPAYCAAA